MTTGHAPTAMLARYAAGTLPPGLRLLVASHLAFCACCRDKADRLEALGGALLAEGDPVAPTSGCLAKALARIAAPRDVAPPPLDAATSDPLLPKPLCRRLARPLCDLDWRPRAPGLAACRIDGFPAERVELLRGDPGACLCEGAPAPEAAALVLAGQVTAGGETWSRGDLAFPQATAAAGRGPCLCLTVRPAPEAEP